MKMPSARTMTINAIQTALTKSHILWTDSDVAEMYDELCICSATATAYSDIHMLYSLFDDDLYLYDVYVRLHLTGTVDVVIRARHGEFQGQMITFKENGTQALLLQW